MPILKNRTQGNFTMVSNGILRDKGLPLKERGLLVTLLGLPDKWDFSIAGLAAILPDGKDGIQAAMKMLEEKGYLTRYQTRKRSGTFGEYVVEVHEVPVHAPKTEKPDAVKPKMVSPYPEIAPQYKKYESITNKSNKQRKIKGERENDKSNGKCTRCKEDYPRRGWTEGEHDLYGF